MNKILLYYSQGISLTHNITLPCILHLCRKKSISKYSKAAQGLPV